MAHDLVISHARLRGRAGTHFIGIDGQLIATIQSEPLHGGIVLDAEGHLVTESFVNAHLHLCKVHTLDLAGEDALKEYTNEGMEGAARAIMLASRVKDHYSEAWIYENARRAVLDGVINGVTHLQAFADTDTRAGLEGVKALLRVRDDCRGALCMRVVAFPQDGVVKDPGAEEVVRRAIELGADVVGGIPWIEETPEDAQAHIDAMLDIAEEFDRPVTMLVDDAGDARLRTTEQLARSALDRGLINRITCCHARALSAYPNDDWLELVDLLRRAQVTFVTDPHTGSLCTRAMDLDRAGLPIALGQDDIADAYYAFGRHNMLEVAFLAAHILGLSTNPSLEKFFDMITTRAADVMRIHSHRIEVGAEANIVALDGSNVREVLTQHRPPKFVISGGRLVATSRYESVLADDALQINATANDADGSP
jgi:cytosine/creatinine deaminase